MKQASPTHMAGADWLKPTMTRQWLTTLLRIFFFLTSENRRWFRIVGSIVRPVTCNTTFYCGLQSSYLNRSIRSLFQNYPRQRHSHATFSCDGLIPCGGDCTKTSRCRTTRTSDFASTKVMPKTTIRGVKKKNYKNVGISNNSLYLSLLHFSVHTATGILKLSDSLLSPSRHMYSCLLFFPNHAAFFQ